MDINWTETPIGKLKTYESRWSCTVHPYTGSIIVLKPVLTKYQRKTYYWRVSLPAGASQILVGKGEVTGTLEQAKQAVEQAIQQHRRER